MSFRTSFASRLEEVRQQAKEAVQSLKKLPLSLPTFDDMAAKDEYIHSEEFNVQGQPRHYQTKRNNDTVNRTAVVVQNGTSGLQERKEVLYPPEKRQGIITMENEMDEESYNHSSEYATTTTWSLLDQPSSNNIIHNIQHDDNNLREETELSKNAKVDTESLSSSRQINSATATTTTSTSFPKPSKPVLLSIVSDTLLQEDESMDRILSAKSSLPTFHSRDSQLPTFSNHSHDDNSSTTSLNEDSDNDNENDPIFSLMRKQQQRQRPEHRDQPSMRNESHSVVSSESNYQTESNMFQNSSHRILDDLECQLDLTENQYPMEMGHQQPFDVQTFHGKKTLQQSVESQKHQPRGSFGGALLDSAMRSWQRMVQRSDTNNPSTEPANRPPLSRVRPKTELTEKNRKEEESFHATQSESVLNPAELEALKRTTTSVTTNSLMQIFLIAKQALGEHGNYLFIAFTMLLAVYVYFFTRKKLEDDVV
ncbi:hypothetical protein IV203_033084 [Nitzschia inconspicua]|uniref:Uncharacterized protein n=1 Tax=Nitzschia inconspicua TaxID=303405 RepID=A0A9K3PFJ1_9STRA|nr:hypothetical protein IV203_033084 [Nitzschia inconspicua]